MSNIDKSENCFNCTVSNNCELWLDYTMGLKKGDLIKLFKCPKYKGNEGICK